MATASAGRADKGSSRAPARSARPCSATASRSARKGRGGEEPEARLDQLLRSNALEQS